ncbi:interferon-gamma-inducible GTPase 10 [Loxodonta africana]|uniref:Interferon-gamma-inducible GTPase IFGGC1 protein n=1 Tax=Loxodonta africana TaxID=9785 RepID=J7PDQ0_LOXAF|nr:T-cell-specific guanine nucleotide triphosphate-binding protein 1 [Loxodonta africana]XP_023407832.1 T-cell-specific guanine nucleotide triphosphate-binding protein 1 [Loxodonta africana]CBY66035.1 TPA: interferon-gamma-inducible GTPase IFGGC1 protein [Loxodonta africana]
MDQFISTFLTEKKFQQLSSEFPRYYSTLINNTGGILSQETLKGIQADLREGKLKDMVEKIQKSLVEAQNAPLDVAVIGESGVGKSSFINALRGLSHEEKESASVGVVETTKEKTPYQHPKYPKVTFWDLPGSGTPNFLPETYLETVEFAKYDFFIIISSTRFTYSDALLAQKIKNDGKKFYFVRTKVDNDLYNEERSKPKSFKKERVLQQIRDHCLANLSHIGVPEPCIFLVSNFDLADFDFPRLEETLLMELPSHKRHTFALLIPCLSDSAIEMKRDFFKGKIWLDALSTAALALIPFMPFIYGFDTPEQEKCLGLYRSHFGLDDKSIKEIAQKLGTPEQEIRSSIKSLDFQSLVKDDEIVAKAKKCVESYCSLKGGLPSSVFQFVKVYLLRLKFLNTVADDAKIILQKTLEG